ncbi:SET and MYND domain-containing protein 4 isoform X2 [Cephus cinctus]|uniref:Protein-lysine N-methyltransferase SMYD4 n=1 Tax=Cephus cinctus TaxID=211228 RepID=A0AAJ7BUU9_CEPCN|nr:SET and MYND domain-containing protein 4 isoform X2 [Cephus cinctus]
MQWQVFLDAINCRLQRNGTLNEIKSMKKCEYELMSCLLNKQDVRIFLQTWLDEQYKLKECKSVNEAKRLKNLGNKEFCDKNYASSITLYTKSTQYAPFNSDELAIAIANRSAALFFTGNYNKCLKDIESSLRFGYPEKLQYKIYLRAAQCHIKLNKTSLANEALLRVQDLMRKYEILNTKKENIEEEVTRLLLIVSKMHDDKPDDSNTNKLLNKPKTAYGDNTNFAFASAAISRTSAPEKGRYVVANRDIKKGQILFVEKPYAFVLLDDIEPATFCGYCCNSHEDVTVPCKTCTNTIYCSIECSTAAWDQYHQWECIASQMNLRQQIGIAHLGLKVLLTNISTDEIDRFNEMQNLVTNIEKLAWEDLLVYSITAMMFTLYLSTYTTFFELDLKKCIADKFADSNHLNNFDINTDNGKQLYISSLLLKHILQLVCNGHAITKLQLSRSNNDVLVTEQQKRKATAIYPSASMMNHSCDPNIINSFWGSYLIVKSTKDITEGSEIVNCYGPHFRRMPRKERQEILQSQYRFTCKCEPCTNPNLQYFVERFQSLKCSKCSGPLCKTNGSSMHCLGCGVLSNILYRDKLEKAQKLFDSAEICIELDDNIAEALNKLKECLTIRKNILYKYHDDITLTFDVIGKVYAMAKQWLNSTFFLEHSLTNIEEQFGPDSVELANELNKITDIYIQYLQEETNTRTEQYKKILKKTQMQLNHAERIMDLNYGPWNDSCQEIKMKKQQVSAILKNVCTI